MGSSCAVVSADRLPSSTKPKRCASLSTNTTLSVAIPGGILTKKRKDTHGCSCQSRCIARVGGLFVDLQGALSSSRSSSRLGTLLDGAADAAAQQKLRYPGSSRSRHP